MPCMDKYAKLLYRGYWFHYFAIYFEERTWWPHKLPDMDWDLLSSYAGLLGLAMFSIYAGAYGSLPVCQIVA
jgi:hypothetical protein